MWFIVKDAVVSDGTAGCERGVLITECLLKQGISVSCHEIIIILSFIAKCRQDRLQGKKKKNSAWHNWENASLCLWEFQKTVNWLIDHSKMATEFAILLKSMLGNACSKWAVSPGYFISCSLGDKVDKSW